MIKLHFDLAKSLELCPPETYYSQFDGVKFIKRIVLKRDLISWKIEDQIREVDASDERVTSLEISYEQRNFVHSQAPQVIEVDPNDKKRFVGRAGFNRNAAQERLKFATFIYDIVDFDSDADRIAFMYTSNDTDSHLPAFANTESTIIKGVCNAVVNETIPDDDDAILKYLGKIAKSKGVKKHESLLKKIRKEHISAWPTMRAWNTPDANKYAKENGLPYEGDKNPKSNYVGYVRSISSYKNLFWDALMKIKEYNWKPALFTSWIVEPKPSVLKDQRQSVIDKYDKMKEDIDSWVCHYTGLSKEKLKEVSKGKFPLRFNGFLPQNVAKNPNDKGKHMENKLVNIDGKEWTRLDQ